MRGIGTRHFEPRSAGLGTEYRLLRECQVIEGALHDHLTAVAASGVGADRFAELKPDRRLDVLRADPRYHALLKKLELM